jgi:hypothetical protein
VLDDVQTHDLLHHECRCPACEPALEPSIDRLGEHHVAIRFGDSRYAGLGTAFCFDYLFHIDDFGRTPGTWHISIDGEPVTSRCYEAIAGDPGRVWLWAANRQGWFHVCQRCRGEICAEQREGHVTITLRRNPMWRTRVLVG